MGLFGFGADKSIKEVGGVVKEVGGVVDSLGGLFNKLFTSDEERLTKKEILVRLGQLPLKMAHELNLLDAKSGSIFRGGWRPAMGWVCVVSAGCYFIPQYLVSSVIWAMACYEMVQTIGLTKVTQLPAYPGSDNGLWQLVTLLFTGSVIRQYDKSEEKS